MKEKSKLVFLDQNKWIDLARAYHGRPEGVKYLPTLDIIKRNVRRGKIILPLAVGHFIETMKRTNLDSRKRLVDVMAEISNGWTLAFAQFLTKKEIEVAISHHFNCHRPTPSALGRGVLFAFGKQVDKKNPRGLSNNKEVDRLRQFMMNANNSLTRLATSQFEENARRHAEAVEHKRRKIRSVSGDQRKRLYAAQLVYYYQAEFNNALMAFGKDSGYLLTLPDNELMNLVETIPTLNVEIALATQRDEFWDKRIDPNDMVDVSCLSVAIPHCRIVITEKFMANLAKRQKLDQKYRTVILSELSDLEQYL